ncbi:hypothetical protein FLK61_36120 [Paenalkalicoccus suaedae]|uniref:Uncharacterized protein n=1 Tax=Paenalkalicoccus suaedae TaxID=2592382 RepID=A0A859FH07_9BACI|nr:hypothetical protein [Paenalkalicoccus suaedae]QKS72090.1 hypothetical protein FLK61_36120 [Paenalkalicoccus suaedae]
MQQISLGYLVQHVSPELMHLLTQDERSQNVVLRNGMTSVNQEDVMEIMEAVIQEHSKKALYH